LCCTWKRLVLAGCVAVSLCSLSAALYARPGLLLTSGPLRATSTEAPVIRWRVALMVFAMPSSTSGFLDGLAVLAYSARASIRNESIAVELVALAHENTSAAELAKLGRIGYKVRLESLLVPRHRIRNRTSFGRREIEKNCGPGHFRDCMEVEMMKLFAISLTEYDRVVFLDSDLLILGSFEELLFDSQPLVATYDHELDFWPDFSRKINVIPLVNSGFWIVTPNRTDFEQIVELAEEADFREVTGWRGARVGWGFGGPASQGLLAYHYHLDSLRAGERMEKRPDLPGNMTVAPTRSRMRILDRSVYNVVNTVDLRAALRANATSVARIRVFHLTGICKKPWECQPSESPAEICDAMRDRWWEQRASMAAAHGVKATQRCPTGGKYVELGLLR